MADVQFQAFITGQTDAAKPYVTTDFVPVVRGGQTYHMRGDFYLDQWAVGATLSGVHPQYFPDYSQASGIRQVVSLTGSLSDVDGSFRDTVYAQLSDSDTTVYTEPHSNYVTRAAAYGPMSGGVWQLSSKNFQAVNGYAKGATSSTPLSHGFAPGLGGCAFEGFQYGTGICSNEFAVHNPTAADGGIGQSISMAAVQGIMDSRYGDVDGSHAAYIIMATNTSTKIITAAYGYTGSGTLHAFIETNTAIVDEQAIVMPGSLTGYVGTIINYGQNNGNPAGGSFTDWLGNVNGGTYRFVNSGVVRLSVAPGHVSILLPTSSAGLVAGEWWNDAGVVKIVP